MVSWADAVFERAQLLSGDVDGAAAMRTALRRIGGEWTELDCAANPIASGITADGAPVEISLRFGTGGKPHLRFIAQPGDPASALALDRGFAARRAKRFIGCETGTAARQVVARLLAHFPRASVEHSGNFLVWLGKDFGQHVSTKIYFNPWAADARYRILPFLESVLQEAGMGSCLAGVSGLARFAAQPLISLIGLNLDHSGITAVKLYFVLDTTAAALADAASRFAHSAQFVDNLRRSVADPSDGGEVHGTMMWSRQQAEPLMRASLYCPDWYRSDAHVVEVVAARLGHAPFAARAYTPAPRHGARWFSFLGIDDRHLTLYSLVR